MRVLRTIAEPVVNHLQPRTLWKVLCWLGLLHKLQGEPAARPPIAQLLIPIIGQVMPSNVLPILELKKVNLSAAGKQVCFNPPNTYARIPFPIAAILSAVVNSALVENKGFSYYNRCCCG